MAGMSAGPRLTTHGVDGPDVGGKILDIRARQVAPRAPRWHCNRASRDRIWNPLRDQRIDRGPLGARIKERGRDTVAGGGKALRFGSVTREAATFSMEEAIAVHEHVDTHPDR